MATNFDWVWTQGSDGRSRMRGVYRDDKLIGRVHRWRGRGTGRMSGEWFTAELVKGELYEPIEGTYATFSAALKQIVRSGVAQ